MASHFELLWRGGATEERLHRRRPGADDLPWGSLKLSTISPEIADEARRIWTNGTFTEYASAAAFAAWTTALLECGAPVDLVAMSADIVVDELFHVELASRLTTELGGAVPFEFDLAKVSPITTPGARPLMRAAEIAITTSCVSESLSLPAMARSKTMAATMPLVFGVLERLLADESQHARVGYWFLDWAADELTEDELASLSKLALATVAVYAPYWMDPTCSTCPIPVGYGGHDDKGRDALRTTVRTSISKPLAEYGIILDEAALLALGV